MRNRGLIAAVIVAGVAAVVAWRMWPESKPDGESGGASAAARVNAQAPAGERGTAAAGEPAGGAAAPASGVRKLGTEERRTLREKIAAARARATERARAQAGDAGVDEADVVIPLERVQGSLRDALQDSIGLLADCYEQQPGGVTQREAVVQMRMTSDPELGTVIDTDEITDGHGAKLSPQLDDCLRDTIDALALPPLGEGGKLDLQYSFRFD